MLSKNCKIFVASTTAAGAAAQTAITTAAIDTSGYEGCLLIIPIGPITTAAVTSVKLQQSEDNSSDGYSDLLGSNQAIADNEDGGCRYIDILRPQKRYLKAVVTRGTQDATIGGIVAILYNAGNRPTTHGALVTGESMYDVAEGTA